MHSVLKHDPHGFQGGANNNSSETTKFGRVQSKSNYLDGNNKYLAAWYFGYNRAIPTMSARNCFRFPSSSIII